jgi:hypothetical protein
MKSMTHLLIAASLVAGGLLARSQDSSLPPGHPPINNAKPAEGDHGSKGPAQNARLSGKAIEVTNAASYTYVLVDTGKEKLWAAVSQVNVKPGDSVVIGDAMEMPHFHSKALGRDFDRVYFSGNITINGAAPAAPAAPESKSAELPKNHPPITGSSGEAKIDFTGIKKAKGGKTIEEIYAGKSKLSGQEVIVRGKVVKYNENILGKNWIHLRDGTGKAGNNDLLVTSTKPAKVGDVVLATGTIILNKDFGSNYKYDVMIDDAKIVVEPSL